MFTPTEGPGRFTPIVIPRVAVKVLPSGFKTYPTDARVVYRPYVFGEVRAMAQMREDGEETLELMASGIETSFPVLSLTLSDFLFISLLRKISTLGVSIVEVEAQCPICDEPIRVVVESDKVAFQDLEVAEVQVEVADKKISIRPLTLGGYLQLKKKGKARDEVEMLAACAAVEGKSLAPEELSKMIFNLTPLEGESLMKADAKLFHGVKPVSAVCASCKGTIPIEVDGGDVLIRPFRSHERVKADGTPVGP